MSLHKIAEEELIVRNVYIHGDELTWTWEIHQELANAPGTVTEIGIEGEPVLIAGSKGNKDYYPFHPIQIQFRIKDLNGLQEKFVGKPNTDFRLFIKESGVTIYELFLYLPTRKFNLYKSAPQVDLVATNGIGYLTEPYVSPGDQTHIKDFLIDILTVHGLSTEAEFFSEWNQFNEASSFPIDYRFNPEHLARFKADATYFEVFQNFCDLFNLKVFMEGTKWMFIHSLTRLDPESTHTGVDLNTLASVNIDIENILLKDDVHDEPPVEFRKGLNKISSTFLVADSIFENPDLQDSVVAANEIPGWEKVLNKVFIQNDEFGKTIVLSKGDSQFPYVRQTTGHVLSNVSGVAEDSIQVHFELELDLWYDPDNLTNSIHYFECRFYSLDGDEYHLLDDGTWYEPTAGDALNFYESVTNGSPVSVIKDLTITPPSEKVGYVEFTFIYEDYDSTNDALGTNEILDLSIEFNIDVERKKLLVSASNELVVTDSEEFTYGLAEQVDYGNLFSLEFLHTNTNWVISSGLRTDIDSESGVLNASSRDKLAMQSQEEVERITITTRKYKVPSFLNTITLEVEDAVFKDYLPLEHKWFMNSGKLEIYASESVFDDTTITLESEYE